MYCCFSKLRTEDMTLRDIAELLEVSQNDIATAVGISKPTVNAYLNGTLKKQEILDKIYRYLNSREFYLGYSFMPTWQFAEFLNTEVLGLFRKKINESDIAQFIGMTPQKFSKLKKCKDTSGITQKLDVVEQYKILTKIFNLCLRFLPGDIEECFDENRKITNEYLKLLLMLNRGYIHEGYEDGISYFFARELKFIIDEGFSDELYKILNKHCKIDNDDDFQRITHDNEFIMDLNERYEIIVDLYNEIGRLSEKVCEHLERILRRNESRNSTSLSAIYDDDEDYVSERFSLILEHSRYIKRIILDNYFAFVDDPMYSFINEYNGDPIEWDNLFYNHDRNIRNALYRVHIVEQYHDFSVIEKSDTCEFIACVIQEHMQNTGKGTLPLIHIFDNDGKLLLRSDYTMFCRVLSDISNVIEIVSHTGPLINLDDNSIQISYQDEYPHENRDYYYRIMPEIDAKWIWPGLIDRKLKFDALDWNLWGLLCQAAHVKLPMKIIYQYILRLKRQRNKQIRSAKDRDSNTR